MAAEYFCVSAASLAVSGPFTRSPVRPFSLGPAGRNTRVTVSQPRAATYVVACAA